MSIIKKKSVKLRAFTIPNKELNKSKTEIISQLRKRLIEGRSIANDRRMLLNQKDENKEEDLLSFYKSTSKYLCGSILKIFPAEEASKIPDDFLEHEQISINELQNVDSGTKIMFKDLYYFYMTDTCLVTNLQGNITIKRLQTYINWLIDFERDGVIYEFLPKLETVNTPKLSDVKNIVFKDSVIYKDGDTQKENKSLLSISKELLKEILNDVESYDEIQKQQIISAKLFVKFKKPKKVDNEQYEKFMGAHLKPISDVEDVNIVTKSGRVIKGSEILLTKTIEIELTESNKIVEDQLFQEMELFIKEISQ